MNIRPVDKLAETISVSSPERDLLDLIRGDLHLELPFDDVEIHFRCIIDGISEEEMAQERADYVDSLRKLIQRADVALEWLEARLDEEERNE